ncbi:MAG: HD domain-containing protein [Streptosporangiaceae bacterium]
MPATVRSPMLTDRFRQAFAMASKVHATQVRKTTAIPYLAHPMSVAALVLEHGGDEDTAIAALLHDAVEDADDGAAVERQIRDAFGGHVADIVLGCSDTVAVPGQDKPPWQARKQGYLDKLAGESDPDVLLVSACDKLHNTRSILADLRADGPRVWERFTVSDPRAQLGYYRALADIYRKRLDRGLAARVAADLDRTLAEIAALAGR